MNDILSLLRRPDKYYLGGGNRLIWAPPFPRFSETPGFWDMAHYYNYELQPLFTWTLLDENGEEVPLRFATRHWDPATLLHQYTVPLPRGSLMIRERKCILPNDVASSEISIRLRGSRTATLHFVAWTAQENHPSQGAQWISGAGCRNGMMTFVKQMKPPAQPLMPVAVAFGLNVKPRSFALQLSEDTGPLPRWTHSPMYEKFIGGRLPDSSHITGVNDEGTVFMALHVPLTLTSGREHRIAVAFAVSPAPKESRLNFRVVAKEESPVSFSVLSWNEYFSGVPQFDCSDPFLHAYYWYRWYGLRLHSIVGGEGNYPSPSVCEGIGYFRAPIAYSAQCHMRENRWQHNPDRARGSLLTFMRNQREDGAFRGYIDVNQHRQEMFYHANWGRALMSVHAVHPSAPFLREAYESLSRYARYFDTERDEEVSGLYDIDNHYETGQEYMHRYTAVSPEADRDNWGQVFRLKGVDVTIYVYELKRALAAAARELHRPGEGELWDIEADRIRHAVRALMWDPAREMFFDVDPATGKRTMVKAATCFYPYFTDIASAEHLSGLKHHLFNPGEFWTPFPVPSSSRDDELFSDEPEWKGKRMNCPWNGRVWPMTNSHIADALGLAATTFNDSSLRRKTAEFIHKFIRMMFFNGDPGRPNCFEHYNPLTGKGSVYRGIDDYQHSWVVDLLIAYVCGIRPSADGLVVDPFPFGLAHVVIDDVSIRGRRVRVEVTKSRVTVWLDGVRTATGPFGTPLHIPLGG